MFDHVNYSQNTTGTIGCVILCHWRRTSNQPNTMLIYMFHLLARMPRNRNTQCLRSSSQVLKVTEICISTLYKKRRRSSSRIRIRPGRCETEQTLTDSERSSSRSVSGVRVSRRHQRTLRLMSFPLCVSVFAQGCVCVCMTTFKAKPSSVGLYSRFVYTRADPPRGKRRWESAHKLHLYASTFRSLAKRLKVKKQREREREWEKVFRITEERKDECGHCAIYVQLSTQTYAVGVRGCTPPPTIRPPAVRFKDQQPFDAPTACAFKKVQSDDRIRSSSCNMQCICVCGFPTQNCIKWFFKLKCAEHYLVEIFIFLCTIRVRLIKCFAEHHTRVWLKKHCVSVTCCY